MIAAFYTLPMELLKIIATCLLAGSVYGTLHDQVTARVCLEYFTVFHPDIFHTHSPTLLAFGWGIIATWWGSLFVGLGLAMAARLGTRPRFSAADLLPRVALLIAAMALFALTAGVSGYLLQGFGMEYYATSIPKQIRHAFYADLWANTASYLGGFVGGVMLCISVWRSRGKRQALVLHE